MEALALSSSLGSIGSSDETLGLSWLFTDSSLASVASSKELDYPSFDELHFQQLYQRFCALDKENLHPKKYCFSRAVDRYTDITPFEGHTVFLDERQRANASYIRGWKDRCWEPANASQSTRLVCSCPRPEQMGLFNRLIELEKVNLIIDFTTLSDVEKQRAYRYFPQELTESKHAWVVRAQAVNRSADACLGFRLLRLSRKDRDLDLLYFHLEGWTDNQSMKPKTFADFLRQVRGLPEKNRSKILAHCSAGAGRAMTFWALMELLDRFERQESCSVLDVFLHMRQMRVGAIQSAAQLEMIYAVMKEFMTPEAFDVMLRNDLKQIGW
jgi:protein tyrosine phosphatase